MEIRSAARTDAGSALCPFCREGLGEAEARDCEACRTAMHAACYHENRGCTSLGCREPYQRAGRERFEAVRAVAPRRQESAAESRRAARVSGSGMLGRLRLSFLIVGVVGLVWVIPRFQGLASDMQTLVLAGGLVYVVGGVIALRLASRDP